MISKNQLKHIQSLALKKNRDQAGLFVAEGSKLVFELIPAFRLHSAYATQHWLSAQQHPLPFSPVSIDEHTLQKLSNQKSPQGIVAVFYKPEQVALPTSGLVLALDDVQDPGNLGTIVRIADWFGVKQVICSENCADVYNPKTVQATMGALSRTRVHYTQLASYLSNLPATTLVFGTFMQGESLYDMPALTDAVVVLGNEGKGISAEIEQLVTRRITVPAYPANAQTSESLNVAVAAAIVCAEFRRKLSK